MTAQMPQSKNDFEANVIAKVWKDEAYRQELLTNPKAVFARETGQQISESVEIRVVEETPNLAYFVIPNKPTNSAELSDAELQTVAGGTVSLPPVPEGCANQVLLSLVCTGVD